MWEAVPRSKEGGGDEPMWTVGNAIVAIIIKLKITTRSRKLGGGCQLFRQHSKIQPFFLMTASLNASLGTRWKCHIQIISIKFT